MSTPSIVHCLIARAESSAALHGYTFAAAGRSPAVRLTFADLYSRAHKIAARIRSVTEAQDRVLLAYEPGLDFIEAFFGCLAAGRIAVPIEAHRLHRSAGRLDAIVEDARPALVLADPRTEGRIRSGCDLLGVPLSRLDVLQEGVESQPYLAEPSQDGIAYLQYTSGSTKTSRGVVITHRNVLANLADIDSVFRHDACSRSVSWLPHFHDMGLVYGILQPLYNGFDAILMSPAAFMTLPERWLRAISLHHATHSGGPDTAYAQCVKRVPEEALSDLDLSSWRVAFTGAEPVRKSTIQAFSERFRCTGFSSRSFFPAYGLAEATLKVTSRSAGSPLRFEQGASEALALEYVSCGSPGAGVELRIVDPDTSRPRGEGEMGEVWVAGPSVAAGYWNRPEETRRVFRARITAASRTKYLRTGDLGFLHHGELFVTGRLKDLIISAGANVHPEDIEAFAAEADPDLAACRSAAFQTGRDVAGEVVLLVETNRIGSLDTMRLNTAIRQAVAEGTGCHLSTVAFVARGALPITSSGKVRRSACREYWASGSFTPFASYGASDACVPNLREAAPNPETRAQARQLILERLGLGFDPSDVSKPLTSLGLDSLRAVEIQDLLERTLGSTVSIERLLSGATVDQIAAELLEQAVLARQSLVGAGSRPEFEASLFQQRLWMLEQIAPAGALTLTRQIRICGPVERRVERALRALSALVARHPALSVSFSATERGLMGFYHPVSDLPVTVVDVCALPTDSRQKVADLLRERFSKVRHDPSRFPLWSAAILLEPADTSLIWSFSHLIADARSLDLLDRDFAIHYATESLGPAPQARYEQFAASQRAQASGARVTGDLEFWAKELSGAPSVSWPSPAGPVNAGLQTRRVSLDPSCRLVLEKFCLEQGMTAFGTLVALFTAALARLTREHDFVVSFPVDNRPAGFHDVAGCFANRLCLRARIDGEQTFADWLDRVRTRLPKALDHRHAAFAQIKDAFDCQHHRTGADPLSQVLFQLRDRPRLTPSGPYTFESEELPPPALLVDLMAVCTLGQGIEIQLLFQAGRFDSDFGDALTAAFAGMIEELPVLLHRRIHDERLTREPQKSGIYVLSNFVADGIGEALEYWLQALGLDYRVRFGPYHQVIEQLLDAGRLPALAESLWIILLRMPVAEAWAAEFAAAREASAASAPFRRYLILCCPLALDDVTTGGGEAELSRLLGGRTAVDLTTSGTFARLYPSSAEWFDANMDRIANIPYTRLGYASVATMIARRLQALTRPPRKVIVVDADGTLWNGNVAEDGPSGVTIDADRLALQRCLLAQVLRGRLLCLCSKNTERDVWEVFDSHPDMLIKREHVTAWRIGWDPKPASLQSLAEDLGLAVGTFVFIDNDPGECAAMRAAWSDVLTVELPPAGVPLGQFLDNIWDLDFGSVTTESRNRTALYRQSAARQQELRAAPTFEAYLTRLALQVEICPPIPCDLPRAAELTLRTTQFNLNCRPMSEAELVHHRGSVLIVRAHDRFGDYGTVGLMIYSAVDCLRVESLLLSCRALGKRIEFRMLLRAVEAAVAAGASELEFDFTRTERNLPMQNFLEAIGAERFRHGWRVSASHAVGVCQQELLPFGVVSAQAGATVITPQS
jgi:FkbH-like protein